MFDTKGKQKFKLSDLEELEYEEMTEEMLHFWCEKNDYDIDYKALTRKKLIRALIKADEEAESEEESDE